MVSNACKSSTLTRYLLGYYISLNCVIDYVNTLCSARTTFIMVISINRSYRIYFAHEADLIFGTHYFNSPCTFVVASGEDGRVQSKIQFLTSFITILDPLLSL